MAEFAERRQPELRLVNLLRCAECGSLSGLYARGWRACRIDDPDLEEPPALAFFCPACSSREFDGD